MSRSQKAIRTQLLDDVPLVQKKSLEEARRHTLSPPRSDDEGMSDDLFTFLCQLDEQEQDEELMAEVKPDDYMTDLLVKTLRAFQDPIFSGIASQASKQGQRQSVEVNVKNLSPEIQKRFEEADAK